MFSSIQYISNFIGQSPSVPLVCVTPSPTVHSFVQQLVWYRTIPTFHARSLAVETGQTGIHLLPTSVILLTLVRTASATGILSYSR